MLTQYRYKIIEPFVIKDGVILKVKKWKKTGRESMPFGMHCYKPSKRRWDYVDYTGDSYYGQINKAESTRELVDRGWLVYIDRRKIGK